MYCGVRTPALNTAGSKIACWPLESSIGTIGFQRKPSDQVNRRVIFHVSMK